MDLCLYLDSNKSNHCDPTELRAQVFAPNKKDYSVVPMPVDVSAVQLGLTATCCDLVH